MPYKAVLFDCDGVLIDSEPMGNQTLAAAVTAAGFPLSPDQAAKIFPGNAGSATRAWMEQVGLDATATAAHADELLFEMFDTHVPLVPGIDTVLSALAVPVAICSNSSVTRLQRSVMRTNIAPHFGPHVYSSDHVLNPKPAPDMALHAASALGIDPSEAIFIDDNIHGVRCARAAGCLAIGFVGPSDHRPNHEETLRQAGATHVVHGAKELGALLKQLI